MTASRTRAFFLFCSVALTSSTASGAIADETFVSDPVSGPAVVRVGDHCAQFGMGFVDVGSGVCQRVSAHVRVYVGSLSGTVVGPLHPWSSGGTSNAALTSGGMVPGSADVTHLRVHGALDDFNPFR
jgi:hypothetical protein